MVRLRLDQRQQTIAVHRQRHDEKYADCVQGCALYLNMSLSGWLRSKSQEDIAPFILEWCQRNRVPEPSLIVSILDGFYIKWLFTAPITFPQFARWDAVQKFLHGKFECLGSDPNFEEWEDQCEADILYQSETERTFDNFARSLPLTKEAGQAYQDARMKERKPQPKRQTHPKITQEEPDEATLPQQGTSKDLSSFLSFFHQPDSSDGSGRWMCIKQMQPLGKGRKVLYDWLLPFDRMSLKTGSMESDFYFSAGEYAIKKRSEKWVSSVRCNFLSLVWERSELDYVPASEEAIGLIYTRCNERGIPRPTFIMHTGDGVFLTWAYEEAIPKLGPSDSFHFNDEWSDVEKFLFSQFWDLGADPRQLHAAAMVRLPGSLNTTAKVEDRRVRLLDAPGTTYSFREMLDCARGDITEHCDQNIPCGWEHDFLAFHKGNRSWVCLGYFETVAGENAERRWKQRWIPAHCLLGALSRINLEQDLYITQLAFSARKRDVKHVASMQVNFLDIDWKLLGGHDMTPEAWKDRILEHCREHRIPEPNAIVFSGNGLHVKWIYTAPIAKEELERWKFMQRLLLSQFEELGADAASIDAARVLRVPGSRNGKTGTVDRRVRLLHHSSPKYAFDEFMDKIKASIPVNPKGFNACLTEIEKAAGTLPRQTSDVCFVMNSENDLKQAEGNWLIHELNFHHPKDAWLYLEDAEGGQQLWVSVRELHHYLRHLDLSQGWRMSPTEFRKNARSVEASRIVALPFNFVNITRCPEGYDLNSQECIEIFKEKCRQVCDVGILEPNQFIYTGQSLLAVWGYNHPLPGIALSRWKAVQEFLTHHFSDWGTESDMTYLNADALLPLTGFSDSSSKSPVQAIYHRSAEYSFDDLATNVLPWSQEEVRKHENEKEVNTEDSTEKQKDNFRESLGFAKKALARYKDITHLLRMRRAASNSIPEGYRELCVFWAMNCGIQAGLITGDNFDAYVQKLTSLCGSGFDDCGPRTLVSLKNRLLSGQKVYGAKTKTLIVELGITPEEQKQMKVINTFRRSRRFRTPRSQWLARHHQEINKPWKKLHISRSTYFARRRRQREGLARKREEHNFAQAKLRAFLSQEGTGTGNTPLTSRTGMSLYYERALKRGRGPALE